MKLLLTTVLIVICYGVSFSQEETVQHVKKIRGAIMMAQSYIPTAKGGGENVYVIPTWAADLDYFWHKRWSVAIQADIKILDFEVEHDKIILERNFPITVAGVLHYHLQHHWSFFTGPGAELEQSGNIFLFKAGTEYSFEVSETFEVAIVLAYENRNAIYDGISLGVALNLQLWNKK